MKTKTLSFTVILLLLLGCSNNAGLPKEDNGVNQKTTSPVYPAEIQATDFSLPEGCGWRFYFPTDLSPHHAFYTINSQDDLKDKLYCENNVPVMDFDKYSLLVFICDYGENLTHQLQQIDEYRYKWNIDIKGTTRSGFLSIAILIPAVPENAVVELNVVLSNSGDELKDTGYIVDSYSCTDGLNGYYIISENLKDTLLSYNLPDIYTDPLIFYDLERPEYSYRYEYKIEFTYSIIENDEPRVCLAMYVARYPNARPVIIKSVRRL
jgi:hypothetical protein